MSTELVADAASTAKEQRGTLLARDAEKARVRLQSAKLENGVLTLAGDEETHRLIDAALGSTSADFQSYALGQLVNLLHVGGDDCTLAINVALAQIAGIGPENEMEAMLAVQMVCAHHAAVEMTRRCLKADRIDFKNTYGNLATKFARTYTAQMEGLAKLRRGGEQVVKHVHVNEGGQAVIAGTVTTGGRG